MVNVKVERKRGIVRGTVEDREDGSWRTWLRITVSEQYMQLHIVQCHTETFSTEPKYTDLFRIFCFLCTV